MTKMIKMSLIAAVAVTGMTSTVCAQPLEDAIKGVDLSGNLRYRHDDGQANVRDTNAYRLEATLKSKVNDMVTVNVSTSVTEKTTDSTGNGNAAIALTEANFAMNINGNTIIAGKQALATPFASGQLEDQQGTGVVALVPVAGMTLAGGLFGNSEAKAGVDGSSLASHNISALAAIGKVASVNYALWYANVSEHGAETNNAGADAMNANISGSVGPVNVELNVAEVKYSGTAGAALGKKEQSRLVLSTKVSDITLAAGYVTVGKAGGDVTLGDDDSSANFGAMEAFSGHALKDTNAYYVAASMPVGPVTLKVEHGTTSDIDGTVAGDVKFNETIVSAKYAMSKNFYIAGSIVKDSSDNATLDKKDFNRIEVKYTF